MGLIFISKSSGYEFLWGLHSEFTNQRYKMSPPLAAYGNVTRLIKLAL